MNGNIQEILYSPNGMVSIANTGEKESSALWLGGGCRCDDAPVVGAETPWRRSTRLSDKPAAYSLVTYGLSPPNSGVQIPLIDYMSKQNAGINSTQDTESLSRFLQ